MNSQESRGPTEELVRLQVEFLARESERRYRAWEDSAGTPEVQDELWQAHEAADRDWVASRLELKQAKKPPKLEPGCVGRPDSHR